MDGNPINTQAKQLAARLRLIAAELEDIENITDPQLLRAINSHATYQETIGGNAIDLNMTAKIADAIGDGREPDTDPEDVIWSMTYTRGDVEEMLRDFGYNPSPEDVDKTAGLFADHAGHADMDVIDVIHQYIDAAAGKAGLEYDDTDDSVDD